MSLNFESPVQTQMAVSLLNRVIAKEPLGSITDGKPVGRRRVFVQTDTGSVLGIELDRSDNAHTIKRRLQVALNVPTEESCLTFGDMVLKNDLSAVRHDSPLLLTRSMMHRSSSTPCLSPSAKDLQQRDRSGPIEILCCASDCAETKRLVKEARKAIDSGVDPVPVNGGLGGAYYFRNSRGESVAIVKPTDEEPYAPNNPKGFVGKSLGQPGLKRSVRVGETGFREVAAYLLDHGHFAKVPPTVLVKINHSIFNINEVNGSCSRGDHHMRKAVSKIASFQQFIAHDYDASDHGTSNFPVAAVHRIGILDVRIFNTDRHAGNLLVRKINDGGNRMGGQVELIPIDHGLCLPESLEDPYFEWIHWPQASIPFSEEELEYIARLDPQQDSERLRRELPMIREACLRVLVLCTIFLKEAATFGLCLAEIGEMMSREYRDAMEAPSELEVVLMEARRLVSEAQSFPPPPAEVQEDDHFQFDLDGEDEDSPLSKLLSPRSVHHLGSKHGAPRSHLSKLKESPKEEEEDDNDDDYSEEEEEDDDDDESRQFGQLAAISNLSMSLKVMGLGGKKPVGLLSNAGSNRAVQWSSQSANEPLPAGGSFVKVGDMGVEEWTAFLDKFQELLRSLLRERVTAAPGQRQRQRLGTSCQF
ncbi:phosphatidylinositol 4-kinase gamma 5-like [Wolffia australiana]